MSERELEFDHRFEKFVQYGVADLNGGDKYE